MNGRLENERQSGKAPSGPNQPNWMDIVRQQVASLQFGVVQITVHEHRVVQVEKTERVRFDQPQPKASNNR